MSLYPNRVRTARAPRGRRPKASGHARPMQLWPHRKVSTHDHKRREVSWPIASQDATWSKVRYADQSFFDTTPLSATARCARRACSRRRVETWNCASPTRAILRASSASAPAPCARHSTCWRTSTSSPAGRAAARSSMTRAPRSSPSASATFARRTDAGSSVNSGISKSPRTRPTRWSARGCSWQPKDRVFRAHRLRLDKDRPFMVETLSLPAALFPDLAKSTACFAPCRRTGAAAWHPARQSRGARLCRDGRPPTSPRRWRSQAGAPVVVLDRVVFALDRRPVEWRIGRCHLAGGHYLAEMK